MPSGHLDRNTLRKQLLATREALSDAEFARLNEGLCAHLARWLAAQDVRTLAFCWPWRAEPDVRSVVQHWLAADAQRRACLPVVVERNAPLTFRRWTPGVPMSADIMGIPVPGAGEVVHPQLIMIPVNGFDARGFRLGYGGGYFDRTLATLQPAPLTAGLGFELSRCARIDEAGHDQPLDWLITEAGAARADR
ncbi:5-formyltetrahydrofolate cyclo-ligase [Viridibacterium curvum]|uniref:5-formyltetrahydrofolate cyclo-ligase n=1 Tax=Viridibacterium curvum TaxID=1101404 RepID=A0ABP9QTD9_9RHOO